MAAPEPLNVVDLRALCDAPAHNVHELSRSLLEGHRALPQGSAVELAAGLLEIKYDSEAMQGRQWMCRPQRDLCVMVSALTRAPAMNYSIAGDSLMVVQFRLSGDAIHGEQVDESTASAMVSYFPAGSRMPWRISRASSWHTIAVFGTLEALEQRWGLGLAMAQALDHTPSTLEQCTQIVRKPWIVTQGVTELLRDLLSFRFTGAVGRAYTEARAQQLLCEVVAGLSDTYRRRPLPTRTRRLLQRVRTLIADNPEQPHTLQSLSRSLGLNRTLLAEAFHTEFGETVFAFLQSERLRQAWTLLEHAERVASVAARVGYRDAASFTRAFKAHYGITPSHVGRRPGRMPSRRPRHGSPPRSP
ncbi:helix-turn-helix transcriptional regulator [Steroidobacter flavus]|uniref:Helix-turn-helix transcriptional regulator n=1 Tax=Steroidobacter flavus TaxID=1842136 RepID=A0ABV8SZQ7_9GAMM